MSTSNTETTVVNSPRSQRANSGLFIFSLLPAIAVAFVVFALGIIARPPEYVAHATFAINWNDMASVLGDEGAEKVRNLWRKELIKTTTSLPGANELADLLDADQKLRYDDIAASVVEAQSQLRITLANQSDNQDSFVIEFCGHNAAQAEAVASSVLHEKVSYLNGEAVAGRMLAIARSKQNLNDVDERRKNGNSDSSELDSQEIQAGLSIMGNTFGMSLTPARVVEKVQVENHIGTHVVRVLFVSVFFGGIMGMVGLVFRRIVSLRKMPRAQTGAIPPKLPTLNVPPVIAQFNIPKPPIVPQG